MQEVLPPESIVIRKDSPAAWLYRGILVVAVGVMGGLGYRATEAILSRLDALLDLPRQVREQGEKLEAQGSRIDAVGKKVDQLAADQAGYAKDADMKDVRSKVDQLDGRVQALENIYSPPEPPGRRK